VLRPGWTIPTDDRIAQGMIVQNLSRSKRLLKLGMQSRQARLSERPLAQPHQAPHLRETDRISARFPASAHVPIGSVDNRARSSG